MSGHMYRGSAHETDSDCGNCDGARCEICVTTWAVYGYEQKQWDTKEQALAYAEEQKKAREELIPGYNGSSVPEYFLNPKTWDLMAYWHDEHNVTQRTICKHNTPLYDKLWYDAVDKADMWDQCTCVDKAEHHYANSCGVFRGCNDSRCFYEMKHCGRTEKKWYM
jgi:hypothetical protein